MNVTITISGPPGSGKTAVAGMLRRALEKAGLRVIFRDEYVGIDSPEMREPGDTEIVMREVQTHG